MTIFDTFYDVVWLNCIRISTLMFLYFFFTNLVGRIQRLRGDIVIEVVSTKESLRIPKVM